MAQTFSNLFGGPKAPIVVSRTSRGRGPSAAGQDKALQARIQRENEARLKSLQAQQEEQNQKALTAQDEQFNNLLSTIGGLRDSVTGAGGTFDQSLGLLNQLGQDGQTRIEANRDRQIAQSEQGLISRGLGNTTIRATNQRGIQSDSERNLQALNESIAAQKTGVLGQKAGAQQNIERLAADSILSRQFQQPNNDLFTQLIAQMFSA